jgi:spore coat protein U-like protein
MRSSKILSGLTAGALLALAGGAQAATTGSAFEVTANVVAACTVGATDMAFPDFDGSADLTATSTISVTCTNGHDYQIALDGGDAPGSTVANRTLSNGTDSLAYNLYSDAGHTAIWGDTLADDVEGVGAGLTTAVDHTVYGQLLAAPNQDVTTGLYSSTITVTVTY